MRAGKLDRLITIQRKTEAVADSGSVVTAWTILATVRAELVQVSIADHNGAFGAAEEGSVVYRIRYLPGLASSDRVVVGHATYDITEIKDIGRRRALEIRCGKVG